MIVHTFLNLAVILEACSYLYTSIYASTASTYIMAMPHSSKVQACKMLCGLLLVPQSSLGPDAVLLGICAVVSLLLVVCSGIVTQICRGFLCAEQEWGWENRS